MSPSPDRPDAWSPGELTFGPNAVFDWLPKSQPPPADKTTFAGDWNNRQAFEIALLWGIRDEHVIQNALEAVSIADGISRQQNIPLQAAMELLRKGMLTDPWVVAALHWRHRWIAFEGLIDEAFSPIRRWLRRHHRQDSE